ncbi:MAG TPA: hypothetical protein VGF61_10405 [Candidatus Acidoferrum sp.]
MALHQINVTICGRTFRPILVTPAHLAKLNSAPVGKELFLSRYYCYNGGDFRAIRTKDGLQYMPSPYHGDPSDASLLEGLLKCA